MYGAPKDTQYTLNECDGRTDLKQELLEIENQIERKCEWEAHMLQVRIRIFHVYAVDLARNECSKD